MSAEAYEPAGVVGVECTVCERDFAPVGDRAEAAFLAGVHNQLEHGGGAVATAVGPVEQAVEVVTGLGWALSPAVFADAQAQAAPFTVAQSAAARAWSVRVDAAVAGMDVLDPQGLDRWVADHAGAPVPHLLEAALVGAWETSIREFYAAPDPGVVTQRDLEIPGDFPVRADVESGVEL